MGKNAFENIQLLVGQFPLAEKDYFGTDINPIATIRHPLDRLLSLANYLYQKNILKKSQIEKLVLETEIDNLQTRFLAGETYMAVKCTADTLAKAKKNIDEKFKVVVPTEEVETLLALVASYFKFENIAWAMANITGKKIVSKNDTELCNKIIARNSYDVELYDYVKSHWEEWKKQHIETVADNFSNNTEYMLLGAEFYNNNQINFLNLDQVLNYGNNLTGLIEGNQLWWG